MGSSKQVVNWLNLQDDLLSLIADRLDLQKDLIRFGAVCHSWQFVYTVIRRRRSLKLPLLMFATKLNHDNGTRSFYSLAEKAVCNSHVPVPPYRFCRGSSHGWLVTVTQDSQVRLENPFSSVEILLPDLTTFTCHHRAKPPTSVDFLCKAILSDNPSQNPNYVVMAIYSSHGSLAYFKPGNSTWTSLNFHYKRIVDVIYYKDQFYFVNRRGKLYSCDLNRGLPKVSKVAATPPISAKRGTYLVESSGELLQIVRRLGYKVFKLDVDLNWIQLENINGCVLFLGDNSCSLCLKAPYFPGCKPNSIYFTDLYGVYLWGIENGVGSYDSGVFSLEVGTIEPQYPTEAELLFRAPIWIEPPL